MFKCLIYIFIIFPSYLNAFSLGQNWSRIRDNNFEVATRTYQNPNNKKTVTLIGMTHVGTHEFYENINRLITNKNVIYEGINSSFEFIKKIRRQMATLPPKTKNRFTLVTDDPFILAAKFLGLTLQNDEVNYDLAKSHMHGDVTAARKEEGFPWGDNPVLWLENRIKMQHRNTKEAELPNRSLDEMAQDIFIKNTEGFPTRAQIAEGAISQEESTKIRESLQVEERNQIVINKLKEALSLYNEVVIAYGSLHLRFFENELVKMGFVPVSGSEIWLEVFKI